MRRKNDALQERLLACAQQLTEEGGAQAVSMRALAVRAGVATGTVYNYFANKDELLLALTEHAWREALEEMARRDCPGDFCTQLSWIIAFLRERMNGPAGRLMSSLGKAEEAGLARMSSMQAALAEDLARRMADDPRIRPDAFRGELTREAFARFLVQNLPPLLRPRGESPAMLLCVARRLLYEP